MTQTTALIVTSALALGILGTLALVVRLAHGLTDSIGRETLHPSQPLHPALLYAEDEEPELARVA